MTRAAGRKSNLPRQPEPGTPEGDEIGLSARQDPSGSPIPGLTGNITNYPTVAQKPAVADGSFDEYRGMMAHGVPNDSETTGKRADEVQGHPNKPGKATPPQHADVKVRPTPIPVYITEPEGGGDVFLSASPRAVTVPAIGIADASRLGGRNPKRNRIGLFNEHATVTVRLAQRPSDLVNGGGALLPAAMTSYIWLETQDEIYALTTSAGGTAVTVSIIEEFEQGL